MNELEKPALVAWRAGIGGWTKYHLCRGADDMSTRCGLSVPKNVGPALTRPTWTQAQKIRLEDVCVTCVNTFTGGSHADRRTEAVPTTR